MSKVVKVFAIDEVSGVELKDQAMVEYTLDDATLHLISTGMLANDDEGVFFQRQLEYIQAGSFDILYPNLKGRELFALNTEGGEGISSITYRSYDKRGETQVIAGKATDLPRGDIHGVENTISVKTLGNAFGYSRQEVASAKLTGLPLEAQKANASRLSYEEKVNALIFFGDRANKLHGFFDGPVDAPCLTVDRNVVAQAAAGANVRWRGVKTPDEIIADLNTALTKMYSDTLQIFRPDMLIMSVANKKLLQNTPRSLQSDVSILNWFLANNDFITSADQIKDVNEVAGIYPATNDAGTPSGALSDQIKPLNGGEGFTVVASGADNMRVREPFPYMHLPVQYKGLEFEVNCYGRFAGLEMIRAAAVAHWVGI